MKWSIKTIKIDDVYMTYNEYWDNPDVEEDGYEFPNHRIGQGKTKQESIDQFDKYIKDVYTPLLNKTKEAIKECIKKK